MESRNATLPQVGGSAQVLPTWLRRELQAQAQGPGKTNGEDDGSTPDLVCAISHKAVIPALLFYNKLCSDQTVDKYSMHFDRAVLHSLLHSIRQVTVSCEITLKVHDTSAGHGSCLERQHAFGANETSMTNGYMTPDTCDHLGGCF